MEAIIYTGNGNDNTEFGRLGGNDFLERMLNENCPSWKNSSVYNRWKSLDQTNPYYRYCALLNVALNFGCKVERIGNQMFFIAN